MLKKRHVVKLYTNGEVTVRWDSAKCEHSGICLRSSPNVFNLKSRPWINMDGEPSDKIVETVGKCPSGALSMAGSEERATEDPLQITIVPNGPFRLKGAFELKDMDGNVMEEAQVASLCRCGASNNKPFCDGTHKKIGFEG